MPLEQLPALLPKGKSLQNKPVISRGNSIWQLAAELLITRKAVRKMSQPSMLRPYASCQLHCLVETEMRVMLLVTYSIESKMLQPLEFRELRLRNARHIGYISNVTEAESEYGHLVVKTPDWQNDRTFSASLLFLFFPVFKTALFRF